jgi:hypothetical protein
VPSLLRTLILLASSLAGASAGMAQNRGKVDVPVMAGGDYRYDACSSTGTIVGLNPRGDGFLSVRSGPGGVPFREIDRVYNGMHVFICDQRGPWFAVVYDHRAWDPSRCNVSSSSWPQRLPYTGPCRYGWIHSHYVGNLAG